MAGWWLLVAGCAQPLAENQWVMVPFTGPFLTWIHSLFHFVPFFQQQLPPARRTGRSIASSTARTLRASLPRKQRQKRRPATDCHLPDGQVDQSHHLLHEHNQLSVLYDIREPLSRIFQSASACLSVGELRTLGIQSRWLERHFEQQRANRRHTMSPLMASFRSSLSRAPRLYRRVGTSKSAAS